MPNRLCSSITESKHIKAVKEPWCHSNHFKALRQMLVTNQRLNKLAAACVDFQVWRMFDKPLYGDTCEEMPKLDEDDDGGAVDEDLLADVVLSQRPHELNLNHSPSIDHSNCQKIIISSSPSLAC